MPLLTALVFSTVLLSVLSDECPPDICPEPQSCCPGNSAGDYNCCPFPDGVCCLDRAYCCPKGTSCHLSENRCVRKVSNRVPRVFQKRQGLQVEAVSEDTKDLPQIKRRAAEETILEINRCDERFYCPNTKTCCQTPDGTYSCCPYAEAVCCPDMLHCCPQNEECDTTSELCVREGTIRPELYKDLTHSAESIENLLIIS